MGNIELIKETMSSLQIAEITGKEHSNVMRDIRVLVEQVGELGGFNFEPSSYKSQQNKELPMYLLSKKECLLLASGYDALLRAKIINRWEELENEKSKGVIMMPDFTNPAEAAIAWAEQYRAKEAAMLEAKSAKDNVKRLVHDNKTYTASEIAKELNLRSATELNKLLESKEIQYKQNGTWLLYAKYADMDYVSIKQIELDNGHIVYDRRFNGKGRNFILSLFNNEQHG